MAAVPNVSYTVGTEQLYTDPLTTTMKIISGLKY